MRGKIIKLTPDDVVRRALGKVGLPITYHLEYPNGGTDPDAGGPQDPHTGGCDCIGFAAWCGGFDRYQPNKFPLYDGYINTDSLIENADGPMLKAWFVEHITPLPGDFVVGHTYRNRWLQRRIGHIGVVVDVSEWRAEGLAGLQVVHCSPGNYQYNGGKSAVWKTNGAIWAGYPRHGFFEFTGPRVQPA